MMRLGLQNGGGSESYPERPIVYILLKNGVCGYMPMMELGVSSNMFDIKKNALKKLSKQQSAYRIKLLSSYKEMVAVVVEMVNASRSLRCYTKLGTESLVQFSCSKEDSSDAGDCGGIPVFNFWNVSTFGKTQKQKFGTCHIDMITKKMAEEFVEMFIREVMIKGLLIMELISLSTEVPQPINNSWSDELYHGEFITSHQMFFLFHGSS
ncbi:predicted protein [Arabidopsis lyrata subsp. lyrata]|uniref:Predicted protein n=1 Tax=Arabidopsis lyrata subsp. lyrata TaxID=81972 RepID=D7KEH5_ARALL|nr:predicted protein [Arabidopsis lyrata subsp. lyrata]